jgi:hypothetical protein
VDAPYSATILCRIQEEIKKESCCRVKEEGLYENTEFQSERADSAWIHSSVGERIREKRDKNAKTSCQAQIAYIP